MRDDSKSGSVRREELDVAEVRPGYRDGRVYDLQENGLDSRWIGDEQRAHAVQAFELSHCLLGCSTRRLLAALLAAASLSNSGTHSLP